MENPSSGESIVTICYFVGDSFSKSKDLNLQMLDMFLNDLWKVLTLIWWCSHCDDCGLTWQNAMVLTRCHGEKRCSSGIHPPMWDFKMDRSTKKARSPRGRIVFQGSGPLLFVHPSFHPSIHPCSHPSMQPSIHPSTASILRYLCRCWPQETSILSSATELVAWFLTSERGLKSRKWSVRRGSIPATNFIPWCWTPQFILPNMCPKKSTEAFCFFWGVFHIGTKGLRRQQT